MAPRNTICLWYDGTALDAAKFYADHAARIHCSHHGSRSLGSQARFRGDDADGKDRHRGDRGGPARLTVRG